MTKPETTDVTVANESSVSTRRQVAAVAASTAVTVVLGVAANLVIAKAAGRVHNMIVPPTKTEDE